MKLRLEDIRPLCPDVGEELVREHLERLDEEYFQRFDRHAVAGHLQGLSRLSSDHPVELIVTASLEGAVECTVLAFDYPFEFSLITGVLSSMGFSILSGDIFTYERPATGPVPTDARHSPGRDPKKTVDPLRRRRIIDHFSGTRDSRIPFHEWAEELRKRMAEIIGYLEIDEKDAVTRTKHRVNEWVTDRLAEIQTSQLPVLYPVQVKVDNDNEAFTRLRVISQDTPAFLYSLSTALSLHNLSIENVRIRTIHGRIEDEIDFVDLAGRPIRDSERLNQVKFSVLFTKQFTYFLDKAPDPYTALARFEHLIQDTLRLPESGQWYELLSNQRAMQDLARILGASDFMWEDFIRLQYESLLPILHPHLEGREMSQPAVETEPALRHLVDAAGTFEEKKGKLNEFKDREIFLIDLDHILKKSTDFHRLAEQLTALAESVIRVAAAEVYNHLVARYGKPCTVAGLEAGYSILGLGKLGGVALGYASDIELLFLYGDSGNTDGREPIGNDEFFSQLARETARFITAKREGIFHVDLRLRPFGSSGPLACSLESFCRYYGPGGSAHSYERLALVRLRAIGGNAELGARVERLRDEFIYTSQSIQFGELHELRAKQFEEKKRGEDYNAKFSPGALVDLEYTVQMLQVLYAQQDVRLRTPRVHEALNALREAGVLSDEECDRLIASYEFLRRLINGLRMLRGSAKDLFLPPVESDEFVHLARRMGYESLAALKPAQQLFLEFEIRTAAVRAFVEKHFGRDSLPGPPMGNVVDLLLSESVPQELRTRILADKGFKNTERAYVNLRNLAGEGSRRDLFAQLAILACDILLHEPDADMALNNWERFIHSLPEAEPHFSALLAQPKRLEILIGIFSRSQFLADTLIRNPEFLDWVTAPENLHRTFSREDLLNNLAEWSEKTPDHQAWRNILRWFRRREILRIGTRDMGLGIPTRDVMLDLSVLAEAIIQATLTRVLRELPAEKAGAGAHFCILAFGKLGSLELNYSSDVDLLGLYDPPAGQSAGAEFYAKIMEKVHADLTAHTEEGYVYRVDLRLRPYGGAGAISASADHIEKYYRETASLWEIQALLKLRSVAGNMQTGEKLIHRLKPLIFQPFDSDKVVHSIRNLRDQTVKKQSHKQGVTTDVKSGLGGIRDIEFLVQGLQLIHGNQHPELFTGNTLQAIDELAEAGLLPPDTARVLAEDYIFLRRVEHYLQILEDRQIHALPNDAAELTALARRMLGTDSNAQVFMRELEHRLVRVHQMYITLLLDHT